MSFVPPAHLDDFFAIISPHAVKPWNVQKSGTTYVILLHHDRKLLLVDEDAGCIVQLVDADGTRHDQLELGLSCSNLVLVGYLHDHIP